MLNAIGRFHCWLKDNLHLRSLARQFNLSDRQYYRNLRFGSRGGRVSIEKSPARNAYP